MAAAEHVIIQDEMAMELPSLPANQGLQAVKDIVFGSVCFASYGCPTDFMLMVSHLDCGHCGQVHRISV